MTARLLGLVVLLIGTTLHAGADRNWQTGECTAVGSVHDVFVSNNGRGELGGIGRTTMEPSTPVVGTYVLETDRVRLDLREIVPFGPGSLQMTVGDKVQFALEKNIVYIKDRSGDEHRLRVTKKTTKKI